MDKAGRVQIPSDLLESMGLSGNKVKIALQDGKVVISGPDQK